MLKSWKFWVVLLLALVGCWGAYAWMNSGPDPQVAEITALMQQGLRDAPPEQRDAQFRELRTRMESLSDEQRDQIWEAGRQAMVDRLRDYVALPPEQQQEFLDQEIDRMQQRQQEWEQRRREREANGGDQSGGGAGGQGPQGGPRDGGPEGRGPGGGDRGGGRGGPGGGGAGGPGGGRGPRTLEQRQERLRSRLDNSTAEERALFSRFRMDMQARMQQRGIQPSGRMGRPF